MTLSESAAAPADEVVLEAVGLTKHFPVRRRLRDLLSRTPAVVHAVDDVSFALRRGQVTALVGESGSGKSTVARLLAQLHPRTAGDVRLHGRSTRVRGGRAFRAYVRRVQLILQDPFASLNPVHTVRYHLTRSLRIHGNAGRTAADLDRALADLLTRVRLTPPERFLDVFPHELSGGQRQRVAIARALGANPEVLLADEPVSMLDVSIRLGVLNLLQDLKERLRLAILYITHDIASARYFADETIVMYAGRMVEGGDSETVTQQPAHPYTRLLISSAPDPDRITGGGGDGTAGGERGHGEPPSLIRPPTGCRFHPRCPHAMPRCAAELPPRLTIGDRPGHWAACWLYDPATAAADAPAAPDADRAVPPAAAVGREGATTLGEAR
ncbi:MULTISPECIES: ABC transporter ATP-binding protein [Micromonospora]|uniref:ABC transporter ATP-binding protein n=1 Tax=Micromonospora solifontis TaxID=2487138 RepID=A0ABX9WIU9_9ACTN|nr:MULTISPECIES: ABC transporter ATP-binding protein [Micromonospora]NES13578.1 ABC transporter ATP-binding protein [Micromonospora sp. PPF5-17B]NES37280.1 ABC transporter ATP-binding protein [Micromonospora solifontis]NES55456.1 ABC transporter ATP-binding protein [Micromonospora sp. PPF5-6]RNL98513.1 ABC transporter ATP-binding protein [Micromonospora solifontis]